MAIPKVWPAAAPTKICSAKRYTTFSLYRKENIDRVAAAITQCHGFVENILSPPQMWRVEYLVFLHELGNKVGRVADENKGDNQQVPGRLRVHLRHGTARSFHEELVFGSAAQPRK
ncbi:MAG: hypothetical protein DDT20_01811 [Firmicutes bacterium]|nr:hypothetical protein [Bacillota bacterium]